METITSDTMGKILEKALKDSLKEDKSVLGSKQVLQSLKDSKLVVLSQSVSKKLSKNILENTKKEKITTVQFAGSSVALGKLCGLQFRVSTISLTSISDANVKSIVKESQSE